MVKRRLTGAAAACILTAVSVAAGAVPAAREELREEFHSIHSLAHGGSVSLRNITGSVRISAWDRDEVKIEAVKSACTRERLDEARIIVTATADAVEIETRYPRGDLDWTIDEEHMCGNPASVSYTLTVPREARLDRIDLINSDLEIDGVAGEVIASTVNGRLNARGLRGRAALSTINGILRASLDDPGPLSDLSLRSVNGMILLSLPAAANVRLDARAVFGAIENDFDLPVRGDGRPTRHGPGRRLEAVLGHGGARMDLNTVNGSIIISRVFEV